MSLDESLYGFTSILNSDDVYVIQKYDNFVLPIETLRDQFVVFKVTIEHLGKLYKKLSKFI